MPHGSITLPVILLLLLLLAPNNIDNTDGSTMILNISPVVLFHHRVYWKIYTGRNNPEHYLSHFHRPLPQYYFLFPASKQFSTWVMCDAWTFNSTKITALTRLKIIMKIIVMIIVMKNFPLFFFLYFWIAIMKCNSQDKCYHVLISHSS